MTQPHMQIYKIIYPGRKKKRRRRRKRVVVVVGCVVDGHAVTQISKVERIVELYNQTGREGYSSTRTGRLLYADKKSPLE